MPQESISYTDASVRFPTIRRPYSDVASSGLSTPIQKVSKSSNNQKTTYKKIIFMKHPLRSAIPNHGYDAVAHQKITQSPASTMPNSCAPEGITHNGNLFESMSYYEQI